MRFHRALGHVQIARDFRVVASLEKQFNDLPVPWAHLIENLFHKPCTCTRSMRSGHPQMP
jgi:hypothetical protein